MHFLAHYYTELPNNHPLFITGLCIPDLWPRFTRVYNKNIVKHPPFTSPDLKQIQSGIVQHFGADKRFHNSPLFLKEVTAAIQSFVDAGLDRQRIRISVIAHLAVEMLIDRQIVLKDKGICTTYYALLNKADEDSIHKYFSLLLLEGEMKTFLLNFRFYKQRRFLLLFEELENIVTGLDKVYGLVTKTAFTATEKQQLLVGLHNIDLRLRYSWQEILN
jgi:hypothetical protein